MSKKSGVLAASVCVVLMAVLVPSVVGTAPADAGTFVVPQGCTDVSPPGGGVVLSCVEEAGLLRLHLGATDRVRYEPDTDGDGVVDSESGGPASPVDQPLTTQGCALTLGNPDLLDLTAGPPAGQLGLRRDSIGVRHQEGGGEPCARVDGAAQTLTLALGSAPELSGKLIDRAEIDIERKFDAVVRAEFYEGGTGGTLVGTLVLGCSEDLGDCGPDSGDGDNFRLVTAAPPDGQTPPAPFDTIVLSNDPSGPGNGAFSLEGGADGTAPGPIGQTLGIDPRDSLFHLATIETRTYEGTLDCGDTDSTAVPSPSDPMPSTATVERLQNKDGAPPSDCVLLPYDLSASQDGATQSVLFDVDTSSDPTAQFGVVITWDREEATNPPGDVTEVDFLDGAGTQDLVWCDGTYAAGASTLAERLAGVEAVPGVGACLAHQEVSVADGLLSITEVIFVSDDPRFLR